MLTLSTPRLQLRALTKAQLLLYLDHSEELEAELGITLSRPILTTITQRAIGMKAKKMTTALEQDHAWYTYWLIVLTEQAHGIGLVGYKGLIAGQEEVEIGYVIEPGHRNQGYMTEAVKAMVEWALADPRCQAVFEELDLSECIVDYASHPDPQPRVDNRDERLMEMTRILMKNAEDISRRLRWVHRQSVSSPRRNGELFEQRFRPRDRSAGA